MALKKQKPPKIEVATEHNSVRVYFDGVLHIEFKRSEYLGLQSWRDGPSEFWIEITLRGGSIKAAYDDWQKWSTILHKLDELLISTRND